MAACVVDHLRIVNAAARTPSTISIFPPIKANVLPLYIENAQVVQFAGYVEEKCRVRGDPLNAEFTRMAMSLGWRPPDPRRDFDVLPLVIREASGGKRLYDLPEDCYRLVAIQHAQFPALRALGLRWYSVPVISDMILTIGGIDYPCAPFNGYYMATEIASRDLTDITRYDLLPQLADVFGFSQTDALWKDRTLTELNAAVLASFQAAVVSIVDHHTASEQCIEFFQAELANGRDISGDWSWITPPQASSACPVFHLPMKDRGDVPNFYRSRATDGANLWLSRRNEERRRIQVRFDRLKRRFRRWRRERFRW
jgi:nitric-oxide synthase